MPTIVSPDFKDIGNLNSKVKSKIRFFPTGMINEINEYEKMNNMM